MERLPREVQHIILKMVGWHHADRDELTRRVALHRQRQVKVYPMSGDPTRQDYRYAVPRFCKKCGEYRECPCLKCELCGHIYYQLVGWGMQL